MKQYRKDCHHGKPAFTTVVQTASVNCANVVLVQYVISNDPLNISQNLAFVIGDILIHFVVYNSPFGFIGDLTTGAALERRALLTKLSKYWLNRNGAILEAEDSVPEGVSESRGMVSLRISVLTATRYESSGSSPRH